MQKPSVKPKYLKQALFFRAIGALYGRLLGKSIYYLIRTKMKESEQPITWDFTDTGAMALVDAASFFTGSCRLPITSVVMMVMSHNVPL